MPEDEASRLPRRPSPSNRCATLAQERTGDWRIYKPRRVPVPPSPGWWPAEAGPRSGRLRRLPAAGADLSPLAAAGALGLGAVVGTLAGSASAGPHLSGRWPPLLRLAFPTLLLAAGAASIGWLVGASGLVHFGGALVAAWLGRALAARALETRIAGHFDSIRGTHGTRK